MKSIFGCIAFTFNMGVYSIINLSQSVKYHRVTFVFSQCGPMAFHLVTAFLLLLQLSDIVFFSTPLLPFLLLFVSTFTVPQSFCEYIQNGTITGEAFLDDFTGKSFIMEMAIHRIGDLVDQIFPDSGID